MFACYKSVLNRTSLENTHISTSNDPLLQSKIEGIHQSLFLTSERRTMLRFLLCATCLTSVNSGYVEHMPRPYQKPHYGNVAFARPPGSPKTVKCPYTQGTFLNQNHTSDPHEVTFPDEAYKMPSYTTVNLLQCRKDAELKFSAVQFCTGLVLDDGCTAISRGLVEDCDYDWYDRYDWYNGNPWKEHPLIHELVSPNRRWNSLGYIATRHEDNWDAFNYWSLTFTATGDGASGKVSLRGIDTMKLSKAIFFPPFWMAAEEPLSNSTSVTGLTVENGFLVARKPHGITLGPNSMVVVRAAAELTKGRAALMVGSTVALGAGTHIIIAGNLASLVINEYEDVSLPPDLTLCIGGGDLNAAFGGSVEFRDGAWKDLASGWTYIFYKPMVAYGKNKTDPNAGKSSSFTPPGGKMKFEVIDYFFAYKGNLTDFNKYKDTDAGKRYASHYEYCFGAILTRGAMDRLGNARATKAKGGVENCPTYSGPAAI